VIETRIEKRLVLSGTAADVDHDKVNTTASTCIASTCIIKVDAIYRYMQYRSQFTVCHA